MYPIRVHEDDSVSLVGPWGDENVGKIDMTQLNPHPLSTGVMAPVLRYLSPARNLLIFERPPHPVTIKYYGKRLNMIDENTKMYEFDIHLPWTMYVSYLSGNTISNVYLFALNGPHKNFADPLFLLPIPNYYKDGRFCIPDETYTFDSISEAMSTTYNIVWDSNFNIDVTEAASFYYEYGGRPEAIWENIHPKDLERQSVAGLLKAMTKITAGDVDNIGDWLVGDISQIFQLPSMQDIVQATPEMFASHVNQALMA